MTPTETIRPPAYGDRMSTATLDERDEAILTFERQWYRYRGAKEQAIRDTFDLTAVRYYQLLNALLDRPAALAAHPVLVKRLRRIREQNRALRR